MRSLVYSYQQQPPTATANNNNNNNRHHNHQQQPAGTKMKLLLRLIPLWRPPTTTARDLQQEQGAGTKVIHKAVIVFCVLSLTIGSLFSSVDQGYDFQAFFSSEKMAGTTRERRGYQNPEDSNYSWTGNHWIAPHSVTTYTPSEMRAIFQRHNVLWIGDSTCRRAFTTMSAIMTAPNPLDVTTREIGDPRINDVNKRVWVEICYNRTYSNSSTGNITQGNLCRQVPGAEAGYGKFDMAVGACYSDLVRFVEKEVKQPFLLEEPYNIIVISLGVWEAIRAGDCRMPNTTGAEEHLQLALNAMEKLSSPSLKIIWRTTGFVDNAVQKDALLVNLNVMAKERIINATNMRVVDWGTAIHARSYHPNKIAGDMSPHYGLEARTLLAQMLTHEVASIEY
jgi:hypothetical protein